MSLKNTYSWAEWLPLACAQLCPQQLEQGLAQKWDPEYLLNERMNWVPLNTHSLQPRIAQDHCHPPPAKISFSIFIILARNSQLTPKLVNPFITNIFSSCPHPLLRPFLRRAFSERKKKQNKGLIMILIAISRSTRVLTSISRGGRSQWSNNWHIWWEMEAGGILLITSLRRLFYLPTSRTNHPRHIKMHSD